MDRLVSLARHQLRSPPADFTGRNEELDDLLQRIGPAGVTIQIAREIGDRRGEGITLGNMGRAHEALGDPRRAVELCERQLRIAREIGDRRGEAMASWNLGVLYEASGELDEAIAAMQVCVDFERAIGHPDAEKDAAGVAELRARRRA